MFTDNSFLVCLLIVRTLNVLEINHKTHLGLRSHERFIDGRCFFQSHEAIGTTSVSVKIDDEEVAIFAYAASKVIREEKIEGKENGGCGQLIVNCIPIFTVFKVVCELTMNIFSIRYSCL